MDGAAGVQAIAEVGVTRAFRVEPWMLILFVIAVVVYHAHRKSITKTTTKEYEANRYPRYHN